MENQIFQVESRPFDAISLPKLGGIRTFYLETLKELVKELEKENNYKLATDTETHYQRFLPTIIFSELHLEKESDQARVRFTCFSDRKNFIQSLEAEGYTEEEEELEGEK